MSGLLPTKRQTAPPKGKKAVKIAEKIYCLYHKDVGCSCIKPVTNIETLKTRVDNQLAIWRLLYRHADESTKADLAAKAQKLKEKFPTLINARAA